MSAWWTNLTKKERQTMFACFGGWSLDAFDVQIYSFTVPTLIAVWGLSKSEAGYIGTTALLFSAFGGWISGWLSDRFGRVRTLQITVLWFAVFTCFSGFAQNFEQLLIIRSLQGLGFGGEWAAGAVLMSEIIRPEYRGRAAGTVHSGFAVGWAGAAILYAIVFSYCPPEWAWRIAFWIGLLPALLVIYIRRFVEESDIYVQTREKTKKPSIGGIVRIFKRDLIKNTVFSSLMSLGMQGGYYAVVTWLPTYLKVERGLSILGTSSYLAVVITGAFCGFLSGAHFADWIGRKLTFIIFGILSAGMVWFYTVAPLSNDQILWLGFPLGFCANAMFAPSGAFFAELFPTAVRGTGQGFCYNLGRGVGALFPMLVGILSTHLPLGTAIGVYAIGAYGVAVIALLFLPETRGTDINAVQVGDASLSEDTRRSYSTQSA